VLVAAINVLALDPLCAHARNSPPTAEEPTLDAASAPRALTATAIIELAARHFRMAREGGGAAVVGVVKDGQIVGMKGYGLANPRPGTPVDPATTLIRIGSVSKLFAAIAALQLLEQDVIDASADVNSGELRSADCRLRVACPSREEWRLLCGAAANTLITL
jgi:CubicO group peptidase (beta-lactamase class C family)